MFPSPRTTRFASTFSPVPTGTVLFITSVSPFPTPGSSSTTVQTDGQIGVPRVGRRSADGHERELGAVEGLGNVEREPDPLGVASEELLEAGLVDRHTARAELLDPLRKDVTDDDLVAQVGEARAGDEADVAGAEDRNP